MHIINAAGSAVWARVFDVVLIDLHEILLMYTIERLSHRAVTMTHRRYRAATAAPRPRGREAKGADAPARRLRAALMSHHQGSMV